VTDTPALPLTDVEQRFIACWGEISALWGVNRSIGRIHALLYLAARPLCAEDITTGLQISHGNCSTSLRDLLAWGVIRRVHLPGERKSYYEAEGDPWTWFYTCIRERRRREIMPLLEDLLDVERQSLEAAVGAEGDEREHAARARARIETFAKFMDEFVDLIDAFLTVGPGPVGKALRAVARLAPKSRPAPLARGASAVSESAADPSVAPDDATRGGAS
jgi:DNA-binding transcriptional regulator GbsR (MarR family)